MPPSPRLPLPDGQTDVDAFISSLLDIATSSDLLNALCGGVHILDIFTQDPSLFDSVIPEEWRPWLLGTESMTLLDLLLRADLDTPDLATTYKNPPTTLLDYIRKIRSHSLKRTFTPRKLKQEKLPRHLSTGMIPKKLHEVTNFADYVDTLAEKVEEERGDAITHFVDFGSGQNYLGRSLANEPYNKHIIAVESREVNIKGAQTMDVRAGMAKREKVLRNKKLWVQKLDQAVPKDKLSEKALRRLEKLEKGEETLIDEEGFDLRPRADLKAIYNEEEGRGGVKYVENRLEDGDLSDVVRLLDKASLTPEGDEAEPKDEVEKTASTTKPSLMAVSIHSCGNLSHHGIRSLVLNPEVSAVAIVGCCYNLLTERLGPPSYKQSSLTVLRPLNHRVIRESSAFDPHGFPMSNRLATHGREGIKLNVTARMMAVQAPRNWTEKESDTFFERHFFRALLQKVFYDRGVVTKPLANNSPPAPGNDSSEGQSTPARVDYTAGRTDPVIIGSLRKSCYHSFTAYARGAVAKLTNPEASINSDKLANDFEKGRTIAAKMEGVTDADLERYEQAYVARKKEVCVLWTLMAFSAEVIETLIVVDRYLFLKEQTDVVADAWVEAVFDYQQSPRNLVVVGVKK